MMFARRYFFAALASLLVAGCGGGDVSIGGTLSGLGSGQTVTLQNNATDNLVLSANGPFTFATPVTVSSSAGSTTTTTTTTTTAPYSVTVLTQPAGQTCTVTNGSGTVSGTTLAVTNVAVSCSAAGSVGGTVIGLAAGGALTLTSTSTGAAPGGSVTVTNSGQFVIPGVLTPNSSFTVTATSPPTGQTCTVANATGTVIANFTANVPVTCVSNAS
jgi:hypothetical protein